jgi:hypothetical protein
MYVLRVGHLYFNFSRPNSFTNLVSREWSFIKIGFTHWRFMGLDHLRDIEWKTFLSRDIDVIKNMYMFEEQEECISSHMIDNIIRSWIKNFITHRRSQRRKVVGPLQYNSWRPRSSFLHNLWMQTKCGGIFQGHMSLLEKLQVYNVGRQSKLM